MNVPFTLGPKYNSGILISLTAAWKKVLEVLRNFTKERDFFLNGREVLCT